MNLERWTVLGTASAVVCVTLWSAVTAASPQPARVVVHVDKARHTSGDVPLVAVALLFVVLVIGVCAGYAIFEGALRQTGRRFYAAATCAWLLVVGGIASQIISINSAALAHGLRGLGWMLAGAVVLTMATITVSGYERAVAAMAAAGETFVHRSSVLGLFFLLLIGLVTLIGFRCPDWICRSITIGVSVVLMWGGALGFRGFTYRVGREGVEVRGVFRQIAWVPSSEIRDAHAGSLDSFVGFGIRSVAGGRAFVLHGRTGVWITTPREKLFLAHEDPARLMTFVDKARSGQ